MIVTRNSQQSIELTEFKSINKLIRKRKEEKRKKKKAKIVEKDTTSNLLDSLKPKTTTSSKLQKSIDADTGIEEYLRETLPLPLCSTSLLTKRRKGNDASKGIIMFY